MMAKIMRLIALFFHNKYAEKIVTVLTILLLMATVSIALRSYYLHKTLTPRYEQKLQKKLNEQVARINAFLDESKANADELASDSAILDYQEKIFLKESILPAEQHSLSSYLSKLQENIGFKSFSLIDNDSTIVFSTDPLLRNVRLNNEIYSTTPLYKSFFGSSMTLTPDFSDIYFSTLIKAPGFYITMPLIRNNKVLGEIAYGIDVEKIAAITRDYLDLGTTGEIVLADQTGPYGIFITPTRNDPFIRFTKKELFVGSGFQLIRRAAQGEAGSGIGLDYREIKVVAIWAFIPRVAWGIVVKIDLQEVLEPLDLNNKYLITFAILTLIFAALTALFHRKTVGLKLSVILKVFERMPVPIRYPEFFLILIFLFLSALSIYKYKHGVSSALKEAQDLAIEDVKAGIAEIETDIGQVRLLANFIVEDLHTERLISEDVRRRLRREIVETEGLVRITIAYAPYKYSDKIRLFAPSIVRKEDGAIIEQQIGELYDYTNKKEGFLETRWYTQASESQKSDWLDPRYRSHKQRQNNNLFRPFLFPRRRKGPSGGHRY